MFTKCVTALCVQNLIEAIAAVELAHPKFGAALLFLLFGVVPVFETALTTLAQLTNTKWDDAVIGVLVRTLVHLLDLLSMDGSE